MDPGTGNIYTTEQAERLGLSFAELIPLEDDEADQLFTDRVSQAVRIQQQKKDKAARAARRQNR